MALAWGSSLEWLPALPQASRFRLNSTGRRADWIITPRLGKGFLAPFADLDSGRDYTRLSDSDLQLPSQFSSPLAKYSHIPAACVRPSTMPPIAGRAFHAGNLRELLSVRLATLPPP